MNGRKLVLVTLLVAVFLQTNKPACGLLRQALSNLTDLINPLSSSTSSNDIMTELKQIRAILEKGCKSVLLPLNLLSDSNGPSIISHLINKENNSGKSDDSLTNTGN